MIWQYNIGIGQTEIYLDNCLCPTSDKFPPKIGRSVAHNKAQKKTMYSTSSSLAAYSEIKCNVTKPHSSAMNSAKRIFLKGSAPGNHFPAQPTVD